MSITTNGPAVRLGDATPHDHAWHRVHREGAHDTPREVYCCDLCTAVWST